MSAVDIAKALGGKPIGGGGFLCSCPCPGNGKGRGDKNPSCSITGSSTGDLLVHCHAGCDPAHILDELRRRGLHKGRARRKPPSTRRPSVRPPADPEPDPRAVELWRSALPAQGTLAEKYLRSRSISLEIPPSIRFIPEINYLPRIALPAMVAAV
jgi:putative DNA primase/helicase